MSQAAPEPAAPAEEETEIPALPPGTVIAERYRVVELLGEGGMGAVYRAEHVHMRKHVALKVLHASVAGTEEIVARFEREAIAAGHIQHPNVAAATDFGKLADGSFFLVLELVEGRSLRRVLNEEAFTTVRAVRVVHQIASALNAAHALGVVHRDLKPENVMIVLQGEPQADGETEVVKVLDFGIAKLDMDAVARASGPTSARQAARPLTRVGAVFGTPDYMSPEQALGQPVDARSDLYSIGIIFYELLTGERPFRGGTVTVLRQHVLDEPPPLPPELLGRMDPRLPPLLQQLLAKTPDARLPSAAHLVEQLAAVLASAASASTIVLAPTANAQTSPSAPTAMALDAPHVTVTTAAPTAERPDRTWLWAGLTLAASLLTMIGLYVGSILLGWGDKAPSDPVEPAPSAAASVAPATTTMTRLDLPPPPPPSAAAAAARAATTGSTAPTPAAPGAVAPAPASITPAPPARTGAAPAPAAASTAPAGASAGKASTAVPAKGKKGDKRSTGPGGIYIPPPKDWFK